LQGVGFDVATKTTIYPRRFLHNETSGFQPQFDFMSYAANPKDLDSWLSPRGWDETLRFLRPYSETHPGATQFASKSSTKNPLSALVHFRIDDATQQATVEKVAPLENRTARPRSTEPSYTVILKAHNNVDILAQGHPSLIAHNPHHGFRHLQATFPMSISSRDTLSSVEIHRASTLLTTHIHPSHAPTITTLSITDPPDLDPGHHTITWTATHADPHPPPISATLSYRNPRTKAWKLIYATATLPATSGADSSNPDPQNPSTHMPTYTHEHTTPPLPPTHFPHNPTAQLLLTGSDNFNAPTTTLSDVFHANGTPPSVHIMSPADGEVFLSGCSVFLQVEGYEDWGGSLLGSLRGRVEGVRAWGMVRVGPTESM